MRMLALFVAFAINFILLFYKVRSCLLGPAHYRTFCSSQSENVAASPQVSTSSAVIEEKEVVCSETPDPRVRWTPVDNMPHQPVTVHFVLEESSGYMEPTLRILAILHTVISFFCIIGYYCLKVSPKRHSGTCMHTWFYKPDNPGC